MPPQECHGARHCNLPTAACHAGSASASPTQALPFLRHIFLLYGNSAAAYTCPGPQFAESTCAGKSLAEARCTDAEAVQERALAFAREESDQALALVCAELAALLSAASACTEALSSALAHAGEGDAARAGWDPDLAPQQPAEEGQSQPHADEEEKLKPAAGRLDSGAVIKTARMRSEEAACALRQCSTAAAERLCKVYEELSSVSEEKESLLLELATSSGKLSDVQQRAETLAEQLVAATSAASSAAQRAEQAEDSLQVLQQQHAALVQAEQDLNRQHAGLETSHVQLQARLSMLQQAKAALEDSSHTQEQAIAELKEQTQELQQRKKGLQAEAEGLVRDREALRDELAREAASSGAERTLHAQAREELAEARQAGASLEAQLDTANKAASKV